jgi:hypothetical protein
MRKKSARVLILMGLVLVAANWFYARRSKAAAPHQMFTQPACKTYVPQEWGDFKGSSEHYGLVFQGNDGTLRFVTNVPCEGTPQIALEVRRGTPNN